jgi:hypothetical protein
MQQLRNFEQVGTSDASNPDISTHDQFKLGRRMPQTQTSPHMILIMCEDVLV